MVIPWFKSSPIATHGPVARGPRHRRGGAAPGTTQPAEREVAADGVVNANLIQERGDTGCCCCSDCVPATARPARTS